MRVDFDDENSPTIATEFVGTSLTSGGNGGKPIAEYERAVQQNDFIKWHNAERGYVSCTLTPQTWQCDFRSVPFVDKPGAPLIKRASFVVEAGQPGAKPI